MQDEEGTQSDKAAIRDSVLSVSSTVRSVQQRKLKLLMPVILRVWFDKQKNVDSLFENDDMKWIAGGTIGTSG